MWKDELGGGCGRTGQRLYGPTNWGAGFASGRASDVQTDGLGVDVWTDGPVVVPDGRIGWWMCGRTSQCLCGRADWVVDLWTDGPVVVWMDEMARGWLC